MFSKYTVETEENRQVQQDLEIYNQLHLSDKTVETKVSCQNQFYQPPRIRQENRDKINIPRNEKEATMNVGFLVTEVESNKKSSNK